MENSIENGLWLWSAVNDEEKWKLQWDENGEIKNSKAK